MKANGQPLATARPIGDVSKFRDVEDRPYLRVREAARLLGVSESWLRQQARAGVVPHLKPHAHLICFHRERLLEWFDRFEQGVLPGRRG